MDDNVKCPYCEEYFEVNQDDGTHLTDGETESDYCPNCDKQVMIYSSCSWYHEVSKADCLNDISDHDWSDWQKLWEGEKERLGQKLERRYCQTCNHIEQEWHSMEVTND